MQDIDGFMNVDRGGTITIKIYSDGGAVPGSQLFSRQFAVGLNENDHWESFAGLGWLLTAGTYWVAFEPDEGLFDADMPGTAVTPLAAYALKVDAAAYGIPSDALNVGVRITGDLVPEPATWGLMILAFAGLGIAMRRRAAARG